MLGEEFTAEDAALPGFELRPGSRTVSPYALHTQTFELGDGPLKGAARIAFTRDADDLLKAAELSIERAALGTAPDEAARLLAGFLHRLGVPPHDPALIAVWRGERRCGEGRSGDRIFLAEEAAGSVRVSVHDPRHVTRACTRCGTANLDAYVFCTWCGERREETPSAPLPAAVPVPLPKEGAVPPHTESAAERSSPLADTPAWERSSPLAEAPAPGRPPAAPPLAETPTRRVSEEQMRALASALQKPRQEDDSGAGPDLPQLMDSATLRATPEQLKAAMDAVTHSTPPPPPVRRGSGARDVFVPVLPLPPTAAPAPETASREAPRDVWTAPPPPPPSAAPLLDHGGRRLGDRDHLFVPAPPEIGAVRSVATSVVQGQDALWRRLVGGLPWAVPLAALAWGGVEGAMRLWHDPTTVALLTPYRWIAPALIALLVLWMRLPTRRVLSYVGSEGVALCDVRFRVWPPRRPPLTVLRFRDARDLRLSIAHRPRRLDYAYVWHAPDGTPLLALRRRVKATPDGLRPLARGDARFYDFARAAERAWTLFLVERVKGLLSDPSAALFFPVYEAECHGLRLQDRQLVFVLPDREVPVPAEALTGVFVKDGVLHLRHEGGEISLPSADVGNVTVLLLVLGHFLAVPLQ